MNGKSKMKKTIEKPRVLIITPEVTYLPKGMGDRASHLVAKAGGLADVSAALISALFEQGADVHVALPDYRAIFVDSVPLSIRKSRKKMREKMPEDRIHLAEDRAFYYVNNVYSSYAWENIKVSLAFQREVINNIIPKVRPDLIHCNDWMTGLIPAVARRMGIPCLFTIHNIFTLKATLSYIEDRGIDAAYFWYNLFYERMSYNYEETRDSNAVDLIASGIFASHFVNTVSPTFLTEIVSGRHGFVEAPLRQELTNKWNAECAAGILNAPDPSFEPSTDNELRQRYSCQDHVSGKKANKVFLQNFMGLIRDDNAPVFFWPSRLDTVQKGCRLLADIMYSVISTYWNQNLQMIFVANGEFRVHFENIVRFHGLENRVAMCDFDEKLARMAYGASDFILMPSLFEPCGLPQMIAPIYGSLPVAHNTGGIHDTIEHLSIERSTGNGFLFDIYDSKGLFWAIQEAMTFFNQPSDVKEREITRIMKESKKRFNHAVTARNYIDLYEKMLKRPLII